MVHEATVAEPDPQHHSILSSGTVSLWNQINDAHSHLDTKASSHFLIQNTQLPWCRQHVLLEERWGVFPQNRALDSHKNSSKSKTNKTRDVETAQVTV